MNRLLRIAILDLLTGNVILSSKIVPVFHKVPDNQPKPYIEIIGQSGATGTGNKDAREFDVIVPIRCHTANLGGNGGDLNADLIAEQVIALIDGNLVLEGYTIAQTDYNDQIFNDQVGNEYQTHKIISFYFNIIKN